MQACMKLIIRTFSKSACPASLFFKNYKQDMQPKTFHDDQHASYGYAIAPLKKEGFDSLHILNKGWFDFWLHNHELKTPVRERSIYINELINVIGILD